VAMARRSLDGEYADAEDREEPVNPIGYVLETSP
jgi:hypothetical protein